MASPAEELADALLAAVDIDPADFGLDEISSSDDPELVAERTAAYRRQIAVNQADALISFLTAHVKASGVTSGGALSGPLVIF